MTTPFERILDIAIQKHALTPAGKDFLEMSLNPFPNHEIKCVGYPDGRRARHTLRVVNDTFSISAPPALVGTYDLHIFSFPQACELTFAIVDTSNHVLDTMNAWLESDGVTPVRLGLFNIILVPTGVETLPVSSFAFTFPAGSQLWRTNYSGFCSGPTRVIAGGFKATCTSPEIYRGGGAVIYRKSAEANDAIFYHSSATSVSNGVSCRQFTYPPATPAIASLLPGTITGSAADGAYVPLIFNEIGPPEHCRYNLHCVMETDVPNVPNLTLARANYAAGVPWGWAGVMTTTGVLTCVKETATDLCGVFFTGVPNEGTFLVQTRVVLESFPTTLDPNITLASLAPDNDPVAIDLYRRIAAEIHLAGVAGSNNTGSWWHTVCKVGLAATVLIPNPLFATIARIALPAAASIADAVVLGSSSRKPVPKSGKVRRR